MVFASDITRSQHRSLGEIPELELCPPYDVRGEISWIDFSGVENPFGTPSSIVQAIRSALADGWMSYHPDRAAHTLRSALARIHGMPVESFLVGTTVPSMISAVAQAFERCTVGISMPCPVEYVLAITNTGHDIENISSPATFITPPADLLGPRDVHIDAALLSNPSWPSSRLLSKPTLRSYLDMCDWVIVDERSIELTLGGESMAPLVRENKNLVVIQSFSEQYSMPGANVSYLIAHPDTIAEIARFYDSSGVSMLAEVLAEPHLVEYPRLDGVRGFLYSEIPWMQCMLSLVPGIDIFPAEANYVMCSYHNGGDLKLAVRDIDELSARLQLEGFLVRKLAGTPGLANNGYFCAAVRTRQDNEKLIEALRRIVSPTS
ncbi:MAG: aminotransferase class I/II-fold pyridoxal phosphate-dependent enzyme [Eggerthellaceae bacterium]|nr:aminotransferase class I/II-fold pyridoxal phosphate-dependent enzyme [Eggerthellaceae bacterium]